MSCIIYFPVKPIVAVTHVATCVSVVGLMDSRASAELEDS